MCELEPVICVPLLSSLVLPILPFLHIASNSFLQSSIAVHTVDRVIFDATVVLSLVVSYTVYGKLYIV